MNDSWSLDKMFWYGLGIAVAGYVFYLGIDARNQFFRAGHKSVIEQVHEGSDLPAGLNGYYPANGPMADYYRDNPEIGVEVEPD
jgi:hypothetical protein